ncbi:hypothetical protein FBU59_004394, partial [Linderina macrospora]
MQTQQASSVQSATPGSSSANPASAESVPAKPAPVFPYIPPAFSLIPNYYLVGLLQAYRTSALIHCTSADCKSPKEHACNIRLKGGLSCLSRIDPQITQLSPEEMEELKGFEERAAEVPLVNEHGEALKVCTICSATETSTWRCHKAKRKSVCNSCGLCFKLHRRDRQIIMKPTGEFFVKRIRKRSRRKAANGAGR